jgi:hypothetical protein
VKQIVHVARQAIASNMKHGLNEPPLIIRDYRGAERHHEIHFVNPATDEVLGRFVYSPDKPLACGARAWIEMHTDKLEARPA